MAFCLPHCLAILQLGGWGQFSETILAFYRRLWFMAKMALESTGSTVIAFSAEEEATILGVCANTIRTWIAYLIANGVLIPLNRKGGRGRKALYRFRITPPKVIHIKTSQQEAVVVPLNYSTTPYGQPTAASDEPQKPTPSPENTTQPPSTCPKDKDTSTHQKKSPAQQRAERLRTLPNETLTVGKIFNWVMEQFRHCCWKRGFTRNESDIVCNAIGRLIKGKPLGYARKLAKWFRKQPRSVLENLREALQKGLRAAYAMLGYLFRKALGILNRPPKPRKKKTAHAHKRWKWDLNDPEERNAFLGLVENIIHEGGGRCPRCGNVIRVGYWTVSSALAFQDQDGCQCLYIALDRDAREREKKHQLEMDTREGPSKASLPPVRLPDLLGDVLHGLQGEATQDPERERLVALQDPEEIRRILRQALDRPGVSHKQTSTTIRGP